MDVIFNCPHCDQELAVDSSGAGSEIECPSCGESIVIPAPTAANVKAAPASAPMAPPKTAGAIAASAAAKESKHFSVPVHDKPTAQLIEKPLAPLEVAAKESDKIMRVKTIRHTDCVEVGHDRFDEIVTNFLGKIGDTNIVSINTLAYSHLDVGTQKLITDYGVMIVYKG